MVLDSRAGPAFDGVHEAVQAILAKAADAVTSKWGDVKMTGRRCQSSGWLMSYVTFGYGHRDAVVMSVVVSRATNGRFLAKGDISGETNGDVYLGEVKAYSDVASLAARDVAAELAKHPEVVMKALGLN